ncbi:MAG: exbD [Verrucomicrobiaceae bacterium]|nr:exbD [Verrucomicrobiaceae bacterium]
MKLLSHLPQSGPSLYIAPLLNTVLLLVVFFMLGSSFIVQSGVSVVLPQSSSLMPNVEQSHIITVTAAPESKIYFDGHEVTLSELRTTMEGEKDSLRRAILQADQMAPYGRVMEVSSVALSLGFELMHATTPEPEP